VEREILPTGGHVGFVAASEAPGRFWAADRVVEWTEEKVA
jgi:predicted alpha/beta-fold hydrolase